MIGNIIASIKESITRYADVYIRMLKVNVIGKSAGLAAYLMYAFICMLLIFCTILLLGFGLVEAFVALGLIRVAAFFVTIGIYLLFVMIMFGLRKSIIRSFSNTIIRILTEGDNEKNNE